MFRSSRASRQACRVTTGGAAVFLDSLAWIRVCLAAQGSPRNKLKENF